MHDLLPGSITLWQRFEATARAVLDDYGFEEIRTPLLERTELFVRSIGGATDIVEKEMYSFADRDGDSLTLRPEQTASCVRAGIDYDKDQAHGALYDAERCSMLFCEIVNGWGDALGERAAWLNADQS